MPFLVLYVGQGQSELWEIKIGFDRPAKCLVLCLQLATFQTPPASIYLWTWREEPSENCFPAARNMGREEIDICLSLEGKRGLAAPSGCPLG